MVLFIGYMKLIQVNKCSFILKLNMFHICVSSVFHLVLISFISFHFSVRDWLRS